MVKNSDAKLCAILSYFLAGIVWYYVDNKMQKNKFAEFHAKQALVLLLVSIVWSVVSGVLTMLTLGLFFPLALLGNLFLFVLWIIGIVYAATDKKTELFMIGQFAKKF